MSAKQFVLVGSLLMIAAPVSCAAENVGLGGFLFLAGLLFFVVGRLMQD